MRFVTTVDALIKKDLHEIFVAQQQQQSRQQGTNAERRSIIINFSSCCSFALRGSAPFDSVRRRRQRLSVVPARRLGQAPALRAHELLRSEAARARRRHGRQGRARRRLPHRAPELPARVHLPRLRRALPARRGDDSVPPRRFDNTTTTQGGEEQTATATPAAQPPKGKSTTARAPDLRALQPQESSARTKTASGIEVVGDGNNHNRATTTRPSAPRSAKQSLPEGAAAPDANWRRSSTKLVDRHRAQQRRQGSHRARTHPVLRRRSPVPASVSQLGAARRFNDGLTKINNHKNKCEKKYVL